MSHVTCVKSKISVNLRHGDVILKTHEDIDLLLPHHSTLYCCSLLLVVVYRKVVERDRVVKFDRILTQRPEMKKQQSLSQSSTPTGSSSSLENLSDPFHELLSPSMPSELRHRSYNRSSDASLINNNTSSYEKLNASSLTQSQLLSPSQQQKLQMRKMALFLLCASGICSCYLYFGIVQERLLSKESPSSAILDRVGGITTFMLVLSSMTNVIVARLWLWIKSMLFPIPLKQQDGRPINHKLLLGGKLGHSTA